MKKLALSLITICLLLTFFKSNSQSTVFCEDFENKDLVTIHWKDSILSGTNTWHVENKNYLPCCNNYAKSGVHFAKCNSPANTYYISKKLDLSELVFTPKLSFWYQLTNGSIYITAHWKSGYKQSIGSLTKSKNDWTRAVFDLSDQNKINRISFRYFSYNQGFVKLDSISIFDTLQLDIKILRTSDVFELPAGNNYIHADVLNCGKDTINFFDIGFQLDTFPIIHIDSVPTYPLRKLSSYRYYFNEPIALADTGKIHDLKIWANKPNNIYPDDCLQNDTLYLKIRSGIAGNYIIDCQGNGDFLSFSEAFDFLKENHLIGSINFEVKPGNYYENVEAWIVKGSTIDRTITFDGLNSDSVHVISTTGATFYLHSVSYFIFKNLSIYGNIGIQFSGFSNYNEVLSCKFYVSSNLEYLFSGIAFASGYSSGGSGWHNKIINNIISGGRSGIIVNGFDIDERLQFCDIINNKIRNQNGYGIEGSYLDSITISKNIIESDSQFAGGIRLRDLSKTIISENYMRCKRGIHLSSNHYCTTGWCYIYNNMIACYSTPITTKSLYFAGKNVKIYNNSIASNIVDYTNSYRSIELRGDSIHFYNNIIYEFNNACLVELWSLNPKSNYVDYNSYYRPNFTGTYFHIYDGTDKYYSSFQNFVNDTIIGVHDINSYFGINPHYLSQSDLHIDTNYMCLPGLATGLLYDYDGDPRCPYGTAIGADEGVYAIPQISSSFIKDDTVCINSSSIILNSKRKPVNVGFAWYVDTLLVSHDKDLIYTFTENRTYIISLVSYNCGSSDTFSSVVYVDTSKIAPVADFTVDKTWGFANSTRFYFTDISEGCKDNWHWSVSPSKVYDPFFYPNGQHPSLLITQPGLYDVKLIAGHGRYKDSIIKLDYLKLYCTPSGYYVGYYALERFRLVSIDDIRSQQDDAYMDKYNTMSTNIDKGVSYKFYVDYYSTRDRKITIWIDYNENGLFENSSEIVFQKVSTVKSFSSYLTIPKTASTGVKRMRVLTDEPTATPNSCQSTKGRYTDYRINIRKEDQTPPVITLIGNDTIHVVQCNPSIVDPGATSLDNYDGDISYKITTTNNIVKEEYGTYWIKYDVLDSSGLSAITVKRIYIISPETDPPNLTILGNPFDSIAVFESYDDPGTKATDYCSGMSKTISYGLDNTKIGWDTIFYKASDKNGNFTIKSRPIFIFDSIAPVIELWGYDTAQIYRTKFFNDVPYTVVIDNYEKNLIPMRSGSYYTDYIPNMNNGLYYIHYNVSDQSGNVAEQVTRVIVVVSSISIKEDIIKQALRIYPNPANNYFYLATNREFADLNLTVRNALGEVILSQRIAFLKDKIKIDLGTYPEGIYYIELQNTKNKFVMPLMLLK